MSISALSSNLVSDLSQQQNPFRQVRQDFRELASALQNGDLSDAQSAYSNIQQLIGTNSGSSNSSGSSTLQNDFAALGQALQSGNLGQAQSAFSQLVSDAQPAEPSAPTASAPDQYVPSQSQNPIEQAIEDYSQLSSDLQSGNLSGAQSAYSNLSQLLGASGSGNNPVANDLSALGQALSSNNLTQAQSAFAQLQTDLAAPAQPSTPTLSPAQQVQQDYSQLESALQNGNVTGAQTAFSALEQALQTQTGNSSATSSTATSDPIANDLNALGQALSSGSLTQAQSAFSQLQSDIQAAQQPATNGTQNSSQGWRPDGGKAGDRHHHHGGDWNNPSSNSTTSSSNSYTATNTNSSVNVYA